MKEKAKRNDYYCTKNWVISNHRIKAEYVQKER